MTSHATSGFAHERLDAFHLAMELTLGVEHLVVDLPRGYADLRDQVRRSAAATARHIAEGANRVTPKDKAARFVIARGEVGECHAALCMLAALHPDRASRAVRLQRLADRVGAMLTGLIRRSSG